MRKIKVKKEPLFQKKAFARNRSHREHQPSEESRVKTKREKGRLRIRLDKEKPHPTAVKV